MVKFIKKLKILFLIIFSIFCLQSYAEEKVDNNIVFLGQQNAPVKIKVFSSLTCPHCANFHIEVISKLKKMYINSGKVQLIFVDFPLDLASFNASKLLHCLDEKKQITYLDTLYEKQSEWTVGTNINEINDNLKGVVKKLGINSNQFDKCINNEILEDKILNGRIYGQKKYSINSTPTVIINEEKLKGPNSFENIKKEIEKLI